jgi:hypothetical protein
MKAFSGSAVPKDRPISPGDGGQFGDSAQATGHACRYPAVTSDMSTARHQPLLFDARREPRFHVHWRGRLQLQGGRVIELRLKDISESGMGLVTSDAVPSAATLAIALRVPDLGGSAQTTEVSGTVQTAYVAMRGYEFSVGAIWVERNDADRELMSRWIGRLRHCS